MTLPDLIARVENGEGEDWDLAADIERYFIGAESAMRKTPEDILPDYPNSLDDVMALVPANLYIVCIGEFKDGFETDGKRWFAKLAVREPHKSLPASSATTPARALLAAILRTMEAGQ